MKIASVADVKAKFSAFLKASESGPLVVTRNGKPVAVILGVHDEDEIERLMMAYSPRLRAILDKSNEQIQKGHGIPHQQFWAEIESRTSRKHRPSKRRR